MKKHKFRRQATALTMAAMMTLLGAQAALAESLSPSTPVTYDPVIAESTTVKSFEVKGIVEYSDLEGGLYTVNGYGLMGLDKELLDRQVGSTVTVVGVPFDGISIFNTKLIEASSIKTAVATTQQLPKKVLIDGSAVEFDQQPMLLDGALMVPLRAVVEAAGGTVRWIPEDSAVDVRLNDRTATFVIGQDQAEMNQDGHYYLVRNMLKMDKAPVIMNSRTLISADALYTVLGLFQSVSAQDDSGLMLVR